MTETVPGTDLVYSTASLEERKDYARALAAAGSLLPRGLLDEQGNPSPGKVLLIAETGNMLGIHPVAALNGVNVIEGKPTISPALMSALVRRAGHKLRVTTAGTIEGGDFQASATLIRADDPHHPYVSTWTPHRAQRAGLCTYVQDPKTGVWTVKARSKYDKVLPWEAYTEALCKARAIGEACRDGAEDALMGVHFTAEELGANVNDQGEVIDGEIVEEDSRADTRGTKGDFGHADETRVTAASDRDSTRPTSARPGPARDAQQAPGRTIDPDTYVDMAMHATTLDGLRNVFRDARKAGLLDEDTSHGMTVREAIEARREALEQQDAGNEPPELAIDGEPL